MEFHSVHSQALSHQRRGFTLVELLLALSLTALIASAIAGMLFGVSRGVAAGDGSRRRSIQEDVARERIDSQLRQAGRILAIGDGSIVLWIADKNGNAKPDLSELRRIEYVSAGKRMSVYEADMSAGSDVTYDLAADFAAITASLRGSAVFPERPVFTGANSWTVSAATPLTTTRLVNYQLVLEDASGTFTVRSATALRGRVPSGG